MAVPEATMWHLLTGLCGASFSCIQGHGMGLGFTLAAAGMDHAIKRWGWSNALALVLIGTLGAFCALPMGFLLSSFGMPFMAFYANSDAPEGRMMFPDDGLSPFARRILKVQCVALLTVLMVGIGMARGQR